MKTTDLQCSKHQCCREMLVKDIDSLDMERNDLLEEIRELAQENQRLRGEIPDWVQAGDNTLHGAIDHWQDEAAKFKAERDELMATVERLREGIKLSARQYRHNHDTSPSLFSPKYGFVMAYDMQEVDKLLSETQPVDLAEVKAQAVEEARKSVVITGENGIPKDPFEAYAQGFQRADDQWDERLADYAQSIRQAQEQPNE